MIIRGDYHTHTTYSDGKSTIEENVLAAISTGLETIAITDHGPGHAFYGISYDDFKEQKEIIYKMREKYPDIEILHGVEANFMDFNGTIDIKDSFLDFFDFICVGYHNGIIPRDLRSKLDFYPLRPLNLVSEKYRQQVERRSTEAMIYVSNNYDVKFITHPGAKFGVDIDLLISNMNPKVMLEINERHLELNLNNLKKVKDSDINLIVSSDAHNAEDIGRVDGALKILEESGISKDRVYNLR